MECAGPIEGTSFCHCPIQEVIEVEEKKTIGFWCSADCVEKDNEPRHCMQCGEETYEPEFCSQVCGDAFASVTGMCLHCGEVTPGIDFCSLSCEEDFGLGMPVMEPQMGINVSTQRSNITSSGDATIDYGDSSQKADAAISGTLDMPNVGVTPLNVVDKAFPEVANVRGIRQASALQLRADRRDEAKANLFAAGDEMQLLYLRKKASYLATIRWDVNNVSGDTLYVGDLVPNPAEYNSDSDQILNPTLFEYTTYPFEFWRGGLMLGMKIIGSKIHSGRIVVDTSYASAANPLQDLPSATSQYAHYIDYSADNAEHVVLFPWRANREWLRRAKTGDTVGFDRDYSMGQFSIRVVNQLRDMESVSDTVQIILFWSAADDFETSFVSDYALTGLSPVPTV
jgi:hypothetical protein